MPAGSEMKTVIEGLGFFALGFVGFLVSFWFAGKVKTVVGIATLFGSGMIGYGLFRAVFGERYPALAWLMAIVSACLGLLVTVLGLYLILGAEFI